MLQKNIWLFRCLYLFLFFTNTIFSQSNIINNKEVAEKLLIKTTLNFLSNYVSESEKIKIISDESTEFSIWILQSLIDTSVNYGFQVYTKTDSVSIIDNEIILSEESITYNYSSLGTKWLFKNKGFRREVEGELHLTIRENDGKVVFSRIISEIYQDTITSKSIKHIEDPNLSFTKGEKHNSSFSKKVIGPVIFTAATLTVVYLFYSLRSNN